MGSVVFSIWWRGRQYSGVRFLIWWRFGSQLTVRCGLAEWQAGLEHSMWASGYAVAELNLISSANSI